MVKKTKNDSEKSLISRLSKRILIVLAVLFTIVVLVAAVLVGVFFALKNSGRLSMEDRRNDGLSGIPDYVYDPSIVNYEGKKYRYNEDLTTILFMGVDSGKDLFNIEQQIYVVSQQRAEKNKTSYEHEEKIYRSYLERAGYFDDLDGGIGQTDVLLLLVIDEKKENVSIISIDRNSMAYFETFDINGNLMGSSEDRLALAYSYGDGSHKSCKMAVSAVSDFLYEIPIHAYYALNFSAVKELNDAVGGVEVTIPIDMTTVHRAFEEGATITLDGEMAQIFISSRQNVGDGTNAERLSRQKQYIFSFIDAAIAAFKRDVTIPADLYKGLSENSCTDISLDEMVYLSELATRVDISYHSINGTTDIENGFAAFRPDEEELWNMILDIFYVCED